MPHVRTIESPKCNIVLPHPCSIFWQQRPSFEVGFSSLPSWDSCYMEFLTDTL
jgi:hypothetical protein